MSDETTVTTADGDEIRTVVVDETETHTESEVFLNGEKIGRNITDTTQDE